MLMLTSSIHLWFSLFFFFFFFFNDTATTEIYTLSLHDALPILPFGIQAGSRPGSSAAMRAAWSRVTVRSEEHTSELQSRQYLVCRLLLEKKKKNSTTMTLFNSTYTPAPAGVHFESCRAYR